MGTVFSISMIKNEADIIESFIRYHLNIVDGMLLLDNGSTDRTLSIVHHLMNEGLPIYLIQDSSLEYDQNEKTTSLMYHAFYTYNPDFVLPLDADEFVISGNDRDHPRSILETLETSKWYYVQTRQYVPHHTDPISEMFIPKRIRHSYGDVDLYKVIVPKEIATGYAPLLTMGNHSLAFPNGHPAEHEDAVTLRLAHFPFRSIEQAKSKIIVGWLNNLARPGRKKDDCFPWGYWFNLFKQKKEISYDQVSELVRDLYGQSETREHPIDFSFCADMTLHYTKPGEVNAMKNILEYSEKLAVVYANLKRNSNPG